jgi:hypothetical protein
MYLTVDLSSGFFRINLWAHFWAAIRRPKNRAFRSKSSDLPMQILWAFRYNPLRSRNSNETEARAYNQPDAIVEQLRELSPCFFAVRRKKTRLYHRRLRPPRLWPDLSRFRLPPPRVFSSC